MTSRPWRAARDRQLHQSLPGGHKRPAPYYAHVRAGQSLPDRENSKETATETGGSETRAAQRTPPWGGLLELGE